MAQWIITKSGERLCIPGGDPLPYMTAMWLTGPHKGRKEPAWCYIEFDSGKFVGSMMVKPKAREELDSRKGG